MQQSTVSTQRNFFAIFQIVQTKIEIIVGLGGGELVIYYLKFPSINHHATVL
jgi:hypothetical protein